MKLGKKIIGYFLVLLGLILIGVVGLARPQFNPAPQAQGVSFSQPHATGIGLNWQEVYQAILKDLQVKHLRLSAYWNVIEPANNKFDFTTIDYQLDEASKNDAKVILSVGRKLPRWPECHVPAWATDLSEADQQEQALSMLEVVVQRYRGHPALVMWQLENEPLLDFGHCPSQDLNFLAREQDLLRSFDIAHPILITDSGELNSWLPASYYGDVLGTTMYRTVFSGRTGKLFHYDYIFPAWLYRLKARYVQLWRAKPVIISELQGEPWGNQPFTSMSSEERMASFSPERFAELHNFSARTQLPTTYWWGVEYWYWEKIANNNDAYWRYAQSVFSSDELR